MSVKLLETVVENTVRMRDLEDGQLAIVLDAGYKNTIVQRYGNNCVAIGKSVGYSWDEVHKNTLPVRILKAGELIQIQHDNEEL